MNLGLLQVALALLHDENQAIRLPANAVDKAERTAAQQLVFCVKIHLFLQQSLAVRDLFLGFMLEVTAPAEENQPADENDADDVDHDDSAHRAKHLLAATLVIAGTRAGPLRRNPEQVLLDFIRHFKLEIHLETG